MSNKRGQDSSEEVDGVRKLKPSELESLKGGAQPGPDPGSHAPPQPLPPGRRPNE